MKGKSTNESELDQALQTPAQQQIANVVRALPEETVSLAWRSQLNGRLALERGRKAKRAFLAWLWKPAAGLALAGALAVAVVLKQPAARLSQPVGSGLETGLMRDHLQSVTSFDVAGVGVTPGEAEGAEGITLPAEWDQEDVTATS